MSPEVQAAIVRVAGDLAVAIQKRYSAPRQPKELTERLQRSFELCYKAVCEMVEPK